MEKQVGLAEKNEEISKIQSDFDNKQNELEKKETEIDKLKKEIHNRTEDTEEIEKTLKEKDQNIIALNQQLDSTFHALESRNNELKELKEEFILMLGPMGMVEFDELKNKNAIEKTSLLEYVDELKELNILSDSIAKDFKISINKIFGENITDEEFEKEVLKVER